jgi:hypothetical protein
MDEGCQQRSSEARRKELLALAERLSTLRNFPVTMIERNRSKLTAYEARLKRIDRSLEDIDGS